MSILDIIILFVKCMIAGVLVLLAFGYAVELVVFLVKMGGY